MVRGGQGCGFGRGSGCVLLGLPLLLQVDRMSCNVYHEVQLLETFDHTAADLLNTVRPFVSQPNGFDAAWFDLTRFNLPYITQ